MLDVEHRCRMWLMTSGEKNTVHDQSWADFFNSYLLGHHGDYRRIIKILLYLTEIKSWRFTASICSSNIGFILHPLLISQIRQLQPVFSLLNEKKSSSQPDSTPSFNRQILLQCFKPCATRRLSTYFKKSCFSMSTMRAANFFGNRDGFLFLQVIRKLLKVHNNVICSSLESNSNVKLYSNVLTPKISIQNYCHKKRNH